MDLGFDHRIQDQQNHRLFFSMERQGFQRPKKGLEIKVVLNLSSPALNIQIYSESNFGKVAKPAVHTLVMHVK